MSGATRDAATPTCIAIVVAAGRGTRAGGPLPKQYQMMAGEPVLRRTLRLFASHPQIAAVLAVIHSDDSVRFADTARDLPKILAPAFGGATRQASVRAGLEALAAAGGMRPDLVLVHDAARPYTSPDLIARAVAAAGGADAAIPVLAVTDTVKRVDADGIVAETLDRAALRTVQTPQAFRFAALRAAHAAAAAAGVETLTDDAAVMEWAGHPVATFEGESTNVKLTTPDDMTRAAGTPVNAPLADLADVRTGTGFDVHAFGPGDHVMLGGVAVPHTAGLIGHSDADVGLHALTDALLGALCDGDIGAHFPPSDPQWKGASSDRFLAHAVEKVTARGGRIAHLDLTLICEAPKVGPHRDAIRAAIARITGVPLARVSVKATTTEKLGFTGRREGIAAMASVTIRLPFEDAAEG
ncbi:bifunctional 2-C-methyl-D-erythritol 4-phosphate cytidylyltransferase/2-C-methyl-D-erythritol 2,4-cyclodiphosphate synthase, partial [Xanthobacter autotrophicus]|uniref:bifunctional 2-C-methyl-D-erythritol 4-phosphate cytidylyltransferase/2-C-methyl-D-erythritol 2,4-cyclodiphosphate synthase n=1 Tax=Xanthobacter TaxID=279 RepID=UPI0024AC5F2C